MTSFGTNFSRVEAKNLVDGKLKLADYDSIKRPSHLSASRSVRPLSANTICAAKNSLPDVNKRAETVFEIENYKRKIAHDSSFSLEPPTKLKPGSRIQDDDVDNLIKIYTEHNHKPYDWQINKAQIDLSREYSTNY